MIIIPNYVIYNDKIRANSKIMYGIILYLSQVQGYSTSTNSDFSRLLSLSKRSIQLYLGELVKAGLIKIEIIKSDRNEVLERKIFIV